MVTIETKRRVLAGLAGLLLLGLAPLARPQSRAASLPAPGVDRPALTVYRHLNTETNPGHAALATGAPPRVTGVVANRWIEQRPDGSMRAVGAAQQWATDAVPGQPPLFYREVERDGRLHMFALSRELELWERSGKLGRSIVRMGAGRAIVSRFNTAKAGSPVPVRFGTLWEKLPAPPARVGFHEDGLPVAHRPIRRHGHWTRLRWRRRDTKGNTP